jgi:hypothetical protein
MIAPGESPKFVKGQLVMVENIEEFWDLCHSQEKSREAIGQICEVQSFRKKRNRGNILNRQYQYAVKLPNGNVHALNEIFLRELTEDEKKLLKMVDKLPELDGIF